REEACAACVRQQRPGKRGRHQHEDDGRGQGDDGSGEPCSTLRDREHEGVLRECEPEPKTCEEAGDDLYGLRDAEHTARKSNIMPRYSLDNGAWCYEPP